MPLPRRQPLRKQGLFHGDLTTSPSPTSTLSPAGRVVEHAPAAPQPCEPSDGAMLNRGGCAKLGNQCLRACAC